MTMKGRILILAAALCAAMNAAAQDTIYKTDAQRIQAKILEVSPSEVRYKRFSNPDGPTYVLPVGDISHIIYQNGERDDFNTSAAKSESAQSEAVKLLSREERRVEVPQQAAQKAAEHKEAERQAAEVPAAGQRDTESVAVRPLIGQVYDDNGVRGLVISLDESGMHGVMISLEESSDPRFLAWSTIRNPAPETGATDKLDGEKNMQAVERYIAENGLSWDNFPAFKWCRDLGEGWYLPALDELLTLGFRFNGDQRSKFDRRARQKFNGILKDNGGKAVDAMANYYSSTWMGDGLAATSTMEIEPPYVESYKLHERYLVRAFRKF